MINTNDIIRNALETPQEYAVIGEVRGEELGKFLDAMENTSGHKVTTTLMCENPSEVVTKFINRFDNDK